MARIRKMVICPKCGKRKIIENCRVCVIVAKSDKLQLKSGDFCNSEALWPTISLERYKCGWSALTRNALHNQVPALSSETTLSVQTCSEVKQCMWHFLPILQIALKSKQDEFNLEQDTIKSKQDAMKSKQDRLGKFQLKTMFSLWWKKEVLHVGLADGWFRLLRMSSRKLQRKLLSNRKGKDSPYVNHRKYRPSWRKRTSSDSWRRCLPREDSNQCPLVNNCWLQMILHRWHLCKKTRQCPSAAKPWHDNHNTFRKLFRQPSLLPF